MEKRRIGYVYNREDDVYFLICSNPDCDKIIGVMDECGDAGDCEVYCSVKCWKEDNES